MSTIFSFPEYENFACLLQKQTNFEPGNFSLHKFPDKESLVRLHTDVKDKDVFIVCGLDDPDRKAIPLMFFAKTAKELGAKSALLMTFIITFASITIGGIVNYLLRSFM